jgi:UDPglucose 6-dehydrogenase
MKIGVVGVGRLGICFALLLERAGHKVLASDIRTNYVALLNQRRIDTNEPDVAQMLAHSKNLEFTTDTRSVIMSSDIIYVMVATPSLADGSYDISAVQRVVDDVRECDFDISGKILVIGCTTNPGDCQNIQNLLQHRGVHVLYNPEFIAQGSILKDLQQADMVLIGGADPSVCQKYSQLYHDIQTTEPCINVMSLTAAEIVKIGINCFLTTKISYANMIGEVLVKSGLTADITPALTAIGNDSRVGTKYLKYGLGFGGPCLPRDNRAFAHYAEKLGLDFPLGKIVDDFNCQHTLFLADQLEKQNQQNLPFYLSYISYKPNTDIFEESQQLNLCRILLSRGHTVYVETSSLIAKSIMDELSQSYGNAIKFRTRQELEGRSIEFFEVF